MSKQKETTKAVTYKITAETQKKFNILHATDGECTKSEFFAKLIEQAYKVLVDKDQK